MERLTGISEITDLPIVLALQESCGEDSCADACAGYGEKGCVGCPVQAAISLLAAYEDNGQTPAEQAEMIAKSVYFAEIDARAEMVCKVNDELTAEIDSLKAAIVQAEKERDAAKKSLSEILEHIDMDEYLRKAFCVHPGREDCPSEAKNGYVCVDDCDGCQLFYNSYSGPQEREG